MESQPTFTDLEPMPDRISFLQPDSEQIRHQIRGILDSYSHEWDMLAELSQNAVDAIERRKPARGHITVKVDATEGVIEFRDNGCGISPSNISKLLRPFGTDKPGSATQIGEKGVGLTFILFSSSFFELESHSLEGSVRATIYDANGWLKSNEDRDLFIQRESIEQSEPGVRLKLKISDPDYSLWPMTFEQIRYLLRTRTALGNTSFIWGTPLNVDVSFTHRDRSNNSQAVEFDCKYLLPTEGLKKDDYISVDEFTDWRNSSDRSDQDKRRKLQNKIVYLQGKKYQAGRDIKFWACFVPNRAIWQKLSEYHGLALPAELEDGTLEEDRSTYRFSGGLFTSTKGMPTGIYLDLKPRGSGGYLPNFYILVEDPSLSFDIGRKYIQSRQQGMIREVAYSQFRVYINSFVKYVSGSIDDPDPLFDREELFEGINGLPDLASNASRFLKRPNAQEATVAGMFFEQLGKGAFPDFQPLISGYQNRYDLYGRLRGRSWVLEFKYNLAGLFRDFSDERKMFDEVDTVVLWEISEGDRKAIESRGLTLSEIEAGVLNPAPKSFPGAQYKLNLDMVKSIDIVCMRKLLKPDE